ncbi:hypothetical protein ATI61_12646 [Archangium gephyra]|uniref:Lipoprotein n=1 Tax=Archangium gephyra TaxID=48 RepID=A0AAC8QID3_9BACT|nr:hypothetical protein [Archangium gephyra]AKJ08257.1 Hypothetical protein AA314_09883 [Archangium gephyra]REG15370.1 hypothetical protein ATI61_12646 [Archangium gephyra]
MAGDLKRAYTRSLLVLAMAVLAGCGPGEEGMTEELAQQELALRAGPRRLASGGGTQWVHTVRSAAETDAPVAVVHDSRGSVLTLGNHRTPVDAGGDVPAGTSVLVLSKYSLQGTLLWTRLLAAPASTGTPYVRGLALAVEPYDTVLLTGVQSGGLELGGRVLPAGAFLARMDGDGEPMWSRSLPTTATELAVNTRGHITTAGTLTGQVDFGNGPVTGASNPYLVQYDAQGTLRWVHVDSARGVSMDLAQDDAGDLYLAGGRFVPPSPLLVPSVSRVSAEGTPYWTRPLEGATGVVMSVAAHGGQVVVSGYFTGKIIFGDRVLDAPTSRGFALAYGRDGAARWGSLLGSTWGLVEMDQGSGVVVAGRYTGGEDFGLGLGTMEGYPGATNVYVLRLQRPSGELQWSHTYPSAQALPVDLSVSRQGESALTGTFRAPVDFGTGPLSPAPGANTFLLQLAR